MQMRLFFLLLLYFLISLKLHSHGQVLAVMIGILPFFFLNCSCFFLDLRSKKAKCRFSQLKVAHVNAALNTATTTSCNPSSFSKAPKQVYSNGMFDVLAIACLSSRHRSESDTNCWTIIAISAAVFIAISTVLRVWRNLHLLRSYQSSNVLVDFFEFLSTEFAAYSKQPSRSNHRKASNPRR